MVLRLLLATGDHFAEDFLSKNAGIGCRRFYCLYITRFHGSTILSEKQGWTKF